MIAPPALLFPLCAGLLLARVALAREVIVLLYEERPPYMLRMGEEVIGLTAAPSTAAFRRAGISYVWENGSMNRQLHLLKENSGQYCVIGWYKTPERIAYAKFTRAIYQDRRLAALVRSSAGVPDGVALEKVLALPGLRVLVKTNYSYGEHVDQLLDKVRPQGLASPQPNGQLAELLKANRADFMFVAEEEGQHFLRTGGAAGALRLVHFADIAAVGERHIACTRSVPDAIIDKLDRAIGVRP